MYKFDRWLCPSANCSSLYGCKFSLSHRQTFYIIFPVHELRTQPTTFWQYAKLFSHFINIWTSKLLLSPHSALHSSFFHWLITTSSSSDRSRCHIATFNYFNDDSEMFSITLHSATMQNELDCKLLIKKLGREIFRVFSHLLLCACWSHCWYFIIISRVHGRSIYLKNHAVTAEIAENPRCCIYIFSNAEPQEN